MGTTASALVNRAIHGPPSLVDKKIEACLDEISKCQDEESDEMVKLLIEVGTYYTRAGHFSKAQMEFMEAGAIIDRRNSKHHRGWPSESLLDAIAQKKITSGDSLLFAQYLDHSAYLFLEESYSTAGLKWIQAAARIRECYAESSVALAVSYSNLAVAFALLEDSSKSQDFVKKSIKIMKGIDESDGSETNYCFGRSYVNLANLVAEEGDLDYALELAKKAETIALRGEGDVLLLNLCYGSFARIAELRGNETEAIWLLRQAIATELVVAPGSKHEKDLFHRLARQVKGNERAREIIRSDKARGRALLPPDAFRQKTPGRLPPSLDQKKLT